MPQFVFNSSLAGIAVITITQESCPRSMIRASMDLSSAFVLALRALGRNKMRSTLTMLGLIIGVGAVIAVIGIGEGAATKAQEQLAALAPTCYSWAPVP
jgi:hypothetical protein